MSNEQKVGLFVIMGILLAFTAIEVTVGTGLVRRGYSLWVEFADVQGLTTGDQVRVAGLKLGTVEEINLMPDRVRVRLRLDQQAVVHRDSVAKLDYQALSGNRFIAVSLGSSSAPVLKDGDTIEGEAPPGLTDMVGELQKVSKSVDDLVTSLNRNQEELLTNLNSFIEENRRTLSMTLANVESITGKLDRGEGAVAKLLNDPELYDRVTALAANLQTVSEQLARGEGTIGRLVYEDDLYEQAREAVAGLNDAAADIGEVAATIRNGEGTIGRLVHDDTLYQDAENALHGLDRATAGIEDQSPIAILGTFVSMLF